MVADDTKAEDGDGEGVAAPVRLAERELCKDLVLVLCEKVEVNQVGRRRTESRLRQREG